MKETIFFEGKKFISSSRAAEMTKYSKDYIGQLCRGGKVTARMVGRSWYVEESSLLAHKKTAEETPRKYHQDNAFKKSQTSPVAETNTLSTGNSGNIGSTSDSVEVFESPAKLATLPLRSDSPRSLKNSIDGALGDFNVRSKGPCERDWREHRGNSQQGISVSWRPNIEVP